MQNGNTHEEGLNAAWHAPRRFWEDPSEENRAALPEWLTFDGGDVLGHARTGSARGRARG
ncbi:MULTISPECIES: hypothetical protein [unclassified Mumia]|uniref:hypothetical protein n=1 Tax=unclassified Mumia TaxID=2621872 RepID=UPI001AB03C58|nr:MULTISPECIES: hypothetical protein [unclassified Mumia]